MMEVIYDNRILGARRNTSSALDPGDWWVHSSEMLSATDILEELKARGITQGKIGEVIGLAQPNVATLFTPEKRTGKPRKLGYDEGIALIREFNLEPSASPEMTTPSAQTIAIVLHEVLKKSADVSLPDATLRPVSEALRLSLELLARNPTIQDSPDAIKAIVDAAEFLPRASMPKA